MYLSKHNRATLHVHVYFIAHNYNIPHITIQNNNKTHGCVSKEICDHYYGKHYGYSNLGCF